MGTKSIPEKNTELDPNRNTKEETKKSPDPKSTSTQGTEKGNATDS